MKVLAINGSPHSDGVVAKGISIMIGELAKENIETEIMPQQNLPKILHDMYCNKNFSGAHRIPFILLLCLTSRSY